jgi:RHS repeat-associated protein
LSFYSHDGHGSVRQLTDASASITDTYTYDAFGILINRTGTTPNDYLYSGEQFDANLGFYYLRARYMNPSNNRFLTQDSFEGTQYDPKSIHKYLYANANPVHLHDPSGCMSVAEVVGVAQSLAIRTAVFVLYNQTLHTVLLAVHLVAFYGDEEYRNLYLGSTPDPFTAVRNDALYMFNVTKNAVGRVLAIRQGMKPLGFDNKAQFTEAVMELRAALQSIGVKDARIGVRGSSVTGISSKGGEFRWWGSDPSDIDFFIESQTLTDGLRTSKNIPGFVHPREVMDAHPPLKAWSVRWSDILRRKVTPGAFEPGTVPNDPLIEGP